MRWASVRSLTREPAAAGAEAATAVREALGPGVVDLAAVFFSAPHVPGVEAIAAAVRERLAPGCLIGCSAAGVVAGSEEIEGGPALAVIAGRLPGVELRPFVLLHEGWEEADDPLAFGRLAPGATGAELLLLLGDPFSLAVEPVLAAIDRHARGLRVVGGMASAGVRPHANALLLNDWIGAEGGVAVALRGALRVDVVVSQGCRPIGPALEVTRAEGHLVVELDGQPALERVEQVLHALGERERERLRHGLYVGRPARGGASGQGDYLIRNLLGADRDRGVLAVGDHLPDHERIRLHVRDAETAREDLELLLSPQVVDSPPHAAFLFLCNGRGRGLYGRPHGDITVLQEALGGAVPAAGMSCAGEIGPVGGRNFLHGHTASIALVRPPAGRDLPG